MVPQEINSIVRQVKEQFHYAPTTPSWLTLDGEYCQILPLLSQEIHDALIAECIICGMPAGSTTEITQPCDARQLFCSSNTVLRSIRLNMKADSPKHQRLQSILKQHDTAVKLKYAGHHSRMFVHGLASVVSALRRTVRCNVIEESFAKCNIIMANCTAKISTDEATNIICVQIWLEYC